MELADSVAWTYHQATNHSLESLRRNQHYLDWRTQPRPYKRYATPLEQVALPREIVPSNGRALEALLGRGRSGVAELDGALLSTLLQLSAGITKWLKSPSGRMPFRAAACTGALYHIELYVVCAELPGVPAGVYHFDVENVALTRLRLGDFRGVLVAATAGDQRVRQAPATVVASSTWWRNSWKYQARTYRHAFWDSGTILANLLTVAAAHDVPAAVLLGFVDSTVNLLLDLDPAHEAALELVPLGSGAPPAPAPEVEPLNLPIEPYSYHEVDYPLIRQVHQASSLATAKDVGEFAQRQLPITQDSALSTQHSPSDDPIESVIHRRGSARQFERTPISRQALETVLAAVSPPIPGDWGSPLSDVYLIVNAVDGLDSGSYFFDRAQQRFEPISLGDFRTWAGRLDLGQELAADAAVNAYFLADLGEILPRLGDRGYRAAQLDASLAAGKLYLASYTLGLAATGLTFFDDEVTDFFSPHAEGKSVMFLLAIGNRAQRR
ncbi:MAG TPA: SagB/ThcOx family dehydrogenase [Chloroflexota bacterium]|nr:SagB/ThcOx family dehydrogenase [Chloroflexota bacterium]